MRKTRAIHIVLSVCTLIIICFTACNSSEELMHPQQYREAQNNLVIDKPAFIDTLSRNGVIELPKLDIKRGYKDHKYAKYLRDKFATLMNVEREDIRSLMLYTYIDYWYGAPYRMGGKDEDGIDCSAFAQRLYTDVFGIDLVRTSKEQFGSCRYVQDKDSLMEGDLVFFRVRGKRISHVGVYLMNKYFVHSATNGGVMISNLNEEYWSRRYAGAGYIPK